MESECHDYSTSNFNETFNSISNQEFFEMIIPKNLSSQNKNEKKVPSKGKFTNNLKNMLKEPYETDSNPKSKILSKDDTSKQKSRILKGINEKIDNIKASIKSKKIEKVIEKQIIPFFCEKEQSISLYQKNDMKVIFLKINNNFRECLKEFYENFNEKLEKNDIHHYEIQNLNDIFYLKKKIHEKFQKYEVANICLTYSEIFENQNKLKDSLKLIFEEIYSFDKFKTLRFCVLFSVLSNFTFEHNIMKSNSKNIEFYESKHLFANFLYEFIKDVNIFPLFEVSILKKLFENFDYCNISFSEAIRRLKQMILFYVNTIDDNENLNLLSSFVNQDDSNKTQPFLNDKAAIGNSKAVATSTFCILEEILKSILNIKKKRKMKILFYYIGKKTFKFGSSITENANRGADQVKNLVFAIQSSIINSKFNHKKKFTDFAEEKFSDFSQIVMKKSNVHKNDKRLKQLSTEIKTDYNSINRILRQMEENLSEFLGRFTVSMFQEIQKSCPFLVLNENNYLIFEKKLNPDILGNIHNAILSDNKELNNESKIILKIFEKFGRQIDINSAYDTFLKEMEERGMNNDQIKVSFFYSLNELKYFGFINPKPKSRMVFQKNIFAKTFFNDYTRKISKIEK